MLSFMMPCCRWFAATLTLPIITPLCRRHASRFDGYAVADVDLPLTPPSAAIDAAAMPIRFDAFSCLRCLRC